MKINTKLKKKYIMTKNKLNENRDQISI